MVGLRCGREVGGINTISWYRSLPESRSFPRWAESSRRTLSSNRVEADACTNDER